MKELVVSTQNPKALDETIQQLGGLVGQNPDGSYAQDADGNYTVRSISGAVDFLAFAMTTQGYAKVIGERHI